VTGAPVRNSDDRSPRNAYRSPAVLALLLLMLCGLLFVVLGAERVQGSFWNQLLVGVGIAVGPAAIIALLYRAFLLVEIRRELTRPLLDTMKQDLQAGIAENLAEMVGACQGQRESMSTLVDRYRDELEMLRAFREAGVLRPYFSREEALRDFAPYIKDEEKEIVIVGSSLKGLFRDEQIREALRLKVRGESPCRVRFLLTHPVFADLRAGQEARQFGAIGEEIIETLETLRAWQVPVEDVRLYQGTPTCFAVTAAGRTLLNTYPYCKEAYDSPCLIVEQREEGRGYFHRAFGMSHFRAWESSVAQRVSDYTRTIDTLRENLGQYQELAETMLAASRENGA